MCEENIVEDECNFMCVCKRYDDARQVLHNKISSKYQDFHLLTKIDKFIYLMKFENIEVAKYPVKAFLISRKGVCMHDHISLEYICRNE